MKLAIITTLLLVSISFASNGQEIKIPPPDTIPVWFKEVFIEKDRVTDKEKVAEYWLHGYIIWQTVHKNTFVIPGFVEAVYRAPSPTYRTELSDIGIPYQFLYADKKKVENKVIDFITDKSFFEQKKRDKLLQFKYELEINSHNGLDKLPKYPYPDNVKDSTNTLIFPSTKGVSSSRYSLTRKDSIMLFGNSVTTMPIKGAPEKIHIGKNGRVRIEPNTTPHYLQDSITKYTQITTYYTIVNNKTKLARYQQILSGFTERAKFYLFGGTKIESILKELQATKRKLEAEYHIKL